MKYWILLYAKASATHLLSFIHIRSRRMKYKFMHIFSYSCCILLYLHKVTWQQCRVVGNVSAGVWWCIYISMKILKAFHERGRKEALSWQAEWSEDKLSTIKKKWRKKTFSHCRHGKVIFHNIEQLLNNKKKANEKEKICWKKKLFLCFCCHVLLVLWCLLAIVKVFSIQLHKEDAEWMRVAKSHKMKINTAENVVEWKNFSREIKIFLLKII